MPQLFGTQHFTCAWRQYWLFKRKCSDRQTGGASTPFDAPLLGLTKAKRIPGMPASMPPRRAHRTSDSENPLSQLRRFDGIHNENDFLNRTKQGHLNCRRVGRACRRRVADFLAHDPRNPRAYGTCRCTRQGNRELQARPSSFCGIPERYSERFIGARETRTYS